MDKVPVNDPGQATALPAVGSIYLEAASADWQPEGDKYWIKPLHNNPATGQRICLAKIDPGAWFPLHAHEEMEHIYVLSGSFYDQDRTLKAGDYACRAPGAMHTAGSVEGAVILLVYNRV